MELSVTHTMASIRHSAPVWLTMLAISACSDRQDDLPLSLNYQGLATTTDSIFESPAMPMR